MASTFLIMILKDGDFIIILTNSYCNIIIISSQINFESTQNQIQTTKKYQICKTTLHLMGLSKTRKGNLAIAT
jgi:hypothetical protein